MAAATQHKKIFVTGGHGYIGCAVVCALRKHGHEVTAMIAKQEHRHDVEQKGVRVFVGDIKKLHEYKDEILNHDILINCALDPSASVEAEQHVVNTLIDIQQHAQQKGKPFAFIFTSGVMVLGNSDASAVVIEDSKIEVPRAMQWRRELEEKILHSIRRAGIVRPAFVWGKAGSHGQKAYEQLKKEKMIEVVGESPGGTVPWIHIDDLAELYALLAEKLLSSEGERFSGIYHFVDGRPSITFDGIFRAFLESAKSQFGLQGQLKHVPLEEARKEMGGFADCMKLHQGHIKSNKTEKLLGWEGPKHGTPLQEMERWVADLHSKFHGGTQDQA